MVLLIVIILVAAAITGSLGGVLEVAAGVALGLLLFLLALGLFAYWFVRRRFRAAGRTYHDRLTDGSRPSRDRYV